MDSVANTGGGGVGEVGVGGNNSGHVNVEESVRISSAAGASGFLPTD